MELARRVADDFRRSLGSLIVYDILFRIVLATVLSPVLLWAVHALVASSGRQVVGNEDIAAFLLSLPGLAAVLAALAAFLFILFFQKAGIVLLAAGTGHGQRLRSVAVLWRTARLLVPLGRLGLLQAGLCVLVSLPFGAGLLLIWKSCLSEHDINFYLATTPPSFWTAVVIGGALVLVNGLVLGLLYVRWSLTVPLVLFEGRGGRHALKESARRLGGSFWRATGVLAGWTALMIVVPLVIMIALDFAARRLTAGADDRLTRMVLIVAGYIALQAAVLGAGAFIWFNGHCVLIKNLYVEACERHGRPVRGQVIEAPGARGLSRLTLVGVSAAVLLIITGVISQQIAGELDAMTTRQTQITAHRGSSLVAPENSLSAIEQAVADGADLAEIDVQETRDGTIVVFHDTDLLRIANLPRKIWEVNYDEIKDLDAGSWFAADFADERIPTLEQAIDAAGDRMKLNIELKFHGHEQAFVERVVEIIERTGFERQCVITSLDLEGLEAVKRLGEDLSVGFIVSALIGDMTTIPVDFLSLQSGLVDHRRVRTLHAVGKAVHVWTVNEPRDMRRMIAYNVDSIITDDPPTAVAVKQELRELTVVERLLVVFRDEFLLR